LLEEDVKEECLKFGSIVHIKVEHLSPDGEVYLKFDHPHGAEQAVKALNGRWFAARQINASVLPEGLYHARFPKSQHL
jgi:RNA-binding protein 39